MTNLINNDMNFFTFWIFSPMEFLTSGAGSKAWRGDVKGLNGAGVNFFYDGQGFMSVELTTTNTEIAFYEQVQAPSSSHLGFFFLSCL